MGEIVGQSYPINKPTLGSVMEHSIFIMTPPTNIQDYMHYDT